MIQISILHKNNILGSSLVEVQTSKPVILLPLRPASQMHKNPQRRKMILGMCPVGCKDRLIDLNVCICKKIISCSCNFCGSHHGCCLTMHISFSLCFALKNNHCILISVYCNTEFWSMSSDYLCMSGYIKAKKHFQYQTHFFFFNWDS